MAPSCYGGGYEDAHALGGQRRQDGASTTTAQELARASAIAAASAIAVSSDVAISAFGRLCARKLIRTEFADIEMKRQRAQS